MSYADFLFLLALTRTRTPWVNAIAWWPMILGNWKLASQALEERDGVWQWST